MTVAAHGGVNLAVAAVAVAVEVRSKRQLFNGQWAHRSHRSHRSVSHGATDLFRFSERSFFDDDDDTHKKEESVPR